MKFYLSIIARRQPLKNVHDMLREKGFEIWDASEDDYDFDSFCIKINSIEDFELIKNILGSPLHIHYEERNTIQVEKEF
jgi:hypothetical protein